VRIRGDDLCRKIRGPDGATKLLMEWPAAYRFQSRPATPSCPLMRFRGFRGGFSEAWARFPLDHDRTRHHPPIQIGSRDPRRLRKAKSIRTGRICESIRRSRLVDRSCQSRRGGGGRRADCKVIPTSSRAPTNCAVWCWRWFPGQVTTTICRLQDRVSSAKLKSGPSRGLGPFAASKRLGRLPGRGRNAF